MLEEGNYTLTNECTIYMISLYLKNITVWLDNLQKNTLFDRCLSFRSVAVITCASHAQGRRFEPGRKQIFYFLELF